MKAMLRAGLTGLDIALAGLRHAAILATNAFMIFARRRKAFLRFHAYRLRRHGSIIAAFRRRREWREMLPIRSADYYGTAKSDGRGGEVIFLACARRMISPISGIDGKKKRCHACIDFYWFPALASARADFIDAAPFRPATLASICLRFTSPWAAAAQTAILRSLRNFGARPLPISPGSWASGSSGM